MKDEPALDLLRKMAEGAQVMANAYPEWLQHEEEAAARMPYETSVAFAQQYRDGDDTARWVIGALVHGLVKGSSHGKKMDVLASFSRESGIPESGLREMMDNVEFWPAPVRAGLLSLPNPPTWSHMARARRGLELADATALVEQAANESWSVAKMEAEAALRKTGQPLPDESIKAIRAAIRALEKLGGIGLPSQIAVSAAALVKELEAEVLSRGGKL